MLERFRQPFDSPQRTPFYYFKTFFAGYLASAAYVQSNLGVANIYGTDTPVEVVKKWAYEKEYSTNRVFSKILSGGLRFGFYEIFKNFYRATLGDEWGQKLRWINFGLAAGTAEVVSVALSLPFENVNILSEKFLTIQQIEKLRTTTDQATLRQLLAEEPQLQKNYYKGYKQALLKNVPYTVISFTAFEILSELTYSQVLKKPKQQFKGYHQVLHSFINGSIVGGLYFGISKGLTSLNIPTVTCNQIALPFYVVSSSLLFGMYNAIKIGLNSQTMGATSQY